jgi:sialate O-acetylesterase
MLRLDRSPLCLLRKLAFVAVAGGMVFAQAGESGAQPDSARLRLPRLLSNGMVIQRDALIAVWGWAMPGTRVKATLRGRAATVITGRDSTWRMSFPAMTAGGPYDLLVEAGGDRIVVRDILVGDVWVASGQSNMALTVNAAKDAALAIETAGDPKLRHFNVPESFADSPADDLAGGSWAAADPQHVGGFSAVAYYFTRDLRKATGVPIGLIHTSWGGANIETWMSRAALGLTDSGWAAILERERARDAAIRDTLLARLGTLPPVDRGTVNGAATWADPALNDSAWTTITAPSSWESAGWDGLDGIAWYRTTFTLTAEEAARGVSIGLGPIDDNDVTWVNGVQVGRTSGYNVVRVYPVPPSALRAGRNIIAIRVEDLGGGGGLTGRSEQLYVEAGESRRSLSGEWKFAVGAVAFRPDGQHINKIPTYLYNRMLHPLLPFPIRGVIWYQGESNANNDAQAMAYRAQFVTLIRSWRREWQSTRAAGESRRELPFLWVQLPNYGPIDSLPPLHAGWATLRESQAAALSLPATAQVVTIDVGEANSLHPRNKQEVGRRLALAARSVAYGEHVIYAGPTYRRHEVRGGRVTFEFDNVGGGLVSRAPFAPRAEPLRDRVLGFAVAGADRRFVWAEARIEGDRVVVWSDAVPNPVAVRYAWANSPENPSLYNSSGLPAPPFRTDDW